MSTKPSFVIPEMPTSAGRPFSFGFTTSASPFGSSYPVKDAAPRSHSNRKPLEDAVYGYIRAVRALGRTSVNTTEIASALGLPLGAVESALSALRDRGVKAR